MITAWWDGIPGLDTRVPYGDVLLADRFTALACAMRVCATNPSDFDQSALLKTANLAEKFLDHFQGAGNERDGYMRRLTLAIACTSAAGKPADAYLSRRLIRLAEWYRQYLAKPPEKRGGTI